MTDSYSDILSDQDDPRIHYDNVVEAWSYLLQEDLHYGYFTNDGQTLIQATDALTGLMLELAGLSQGQTVLDVGCGTGKSACRIATEKQCSVVGISPSTVCVAKANQLARQLRVYPEASFCIGDGANPAFADASFDCVWVMESSHLIADKQALIKQCARVLKPGGRLVLCDVMLVRKLPLQEVIQYRDEFLLLKDVFGRAVMQPAAFYVEQLESNGLRVLAQQNITEQTRLTFKFWKENAITNRDKVVAVVNETQWRNFVNSCSILDKFWNDEILGYAALAAQKPL